VLNIPKGISIETYDLYESGEWAGKASLRIDLPIPHRRPKVEV
jgi:hypothetical protein